ncbi:MULTISPECIES: hypothetical protein [Vagococcus]|uniref:Uncharacterized protein n=1 Tax=Vagococcus fluvialis bH819 TaxID=1255619 RepID=A0A1X6WSB4_9ENTE|nr:MULTISPECIES: hypothetical protein [Vagococcus]SLM87233.1 hypothetical protein FM121_14125 [Vagococcus fluvialis bH819]HCM89101.1 hypothetical protein [Vagococcus sp.]
MKTIKKSVILSVAAISLCTGGVKLAMATSLDSKLNDQKIVSNENNISLKSNQNGSSQAIAVDSNSEKLPSGSISADEAAAIGSKKLSSVMKYQVGNQKINMKSVKSFDGRWTWQGNIPVSENEATEFIIDATSGELIFMGQPTPTEYTEPKLLNIDETNKHWEKNSMSYIDDVKKVASEFSGQEVESVKFDYVGIGLQSTSQEDNDKIVEIEKNKKENEIMSNYTNLNFIVTTKDGKKTAVTITPENKIISHVSAITPETTEGLG